MRQPPGGAILGMPTPSRSPDVAGQLLTPQVQTSLKQTSGAQNIRVVRQGDMTTSEMISGRLTIVIDKDNRIVRVYEG